MDFKKFLIPLITLTCLSCPPSKKEIGGINEEYIFSSDKELNKEYINYLLEIDKREKQLEFVSIEKGKKRYLAFYSKFQTIFTAEENMYLIKGLDESSMEEIDEYYKPIKNLLNELNLIYEKETVISKRFEIMYRKISERMVIGEGNNEAISLEYLVNGIKGDCNDISPAYFALLNYYGIPTYLRMGTILEKGKELGHHVWLTVETEKGWIDVDPVGYSFMIPLDDRNEEIELILLKEESMFYKGEPPKRSIIPAE